MLYAALDLCWYFLLLKYKLIYVYSQKISRRIVELCVFVCVCVCVCVCECDVCMSAYVCVYSILSKLNL